MYNVHMLGCKRHLLQLITELKVNIINVYIGFGFGLVFSSSVASRHPATLSLNNDKLCRCLLLNPITGFLAASESGIRATRVYVHMYQDPAQTFLHSLQSRYVYSHTSNVLKFRQALPELFSAHSEAQDLDIYSGRTAHTSSNFARASVYPTYIRKHRLSKFSNLIIKT